MTSKKKKQNPKAISKDEHQDQVADGQNAAFKGTNKYPFVLDMNKNN